MTAVDKWAIAALVFTVLALMAFWARERRKLRIADAERERQRHIDWEAAEALHRRKLADIRTRLHDYDAEWKAIKSNSASVTAPQRVRQRTAAPWRNNEAPAPAGSVYRYPQADEPSQNAELASAIVRELFEDTASTIQATQPDSSSDYTGGGGDFGGAGASGGWDDDNKGNGGSNE